MTELTEKWRNYFEQECQPAIQGFADAYPDQRSLYVDLVDVHTFDEAFLRALFDDPESGFTAGESVLGELTGVEGPVHVRVENNPQQRSVGDIRASYVGGLVTVTGEVETVGPPRAMAVTAAYECPICAASETLSQAGIDLATPTLCDNCGWDGEFTLLTGDSRFVDRQEITLASPPDENGWITTLTVYLDDDIVGTATEGDPHSVTGIVRVHRGDEVNQFQLYLDALSIREEGKAKAPETPDGVLDSHWGLGE